MAKYDVTNPTPAIRVINAMHGKSHRHVAIQPGTTKEDVEITDDEAQYLKDAAKKAGENKEVILKPSSGRSASNADNPGLFGGSASTSQVDADQAKKARADASSAAANAKKK